MPLDDAIALVGRSFEKYVEGLREKAKAAAAPLTARVFLPATAEVAYLLNLLADNRALTIDELNTVIKYLQERRDKLIDAESRPIVTDGESIKLFLLSLSLALTLFKLLFSLYEFKFNLKTFIFLFNKWVLLLLQCNYNYSL